MKKEAILFLLAFILGTLYGQQFFNWIYIKISEIKAQALGYNTIIVNKDYITLKKVGDSYYLYLDIEKPIKTVLYIPLNSSKIDYYYNISQYLDIYVNGNKENLNVIINHKMPIVP